MFDATVSLMYLEGGVLKGWVYFTKLWLM